MIKPQLIATSLIFGIVLSGCNGGGTYSKLTPAPPPVPGPSKVIIVPQDRTADSGLQTEPETPENNDNIGIDLREIAKYDAKGAPLSKVASLLIDRMHNSPTDFFPRGVTFLKRGPSIGSESQKNSVYGVEFVKFETNTDETSTYVLNAFFHTDSSGFYFRTFSVVVDKDSSKILQIDVLKEIPASVTHFKMKIGLMQRKIILDDVENHIRKIYPVGLGGFDEGVSKKGKLSALTPKFKIAYLEKSAAIFSRTYPEYYKGRPFIRISNGLGNYTSFGFHYSITDTLIRGFVSHGCIRMTDKDVYELYYLLSETSGGVIPLEMRYHLKDTSDTPYPLDNSDYWRVKNFGTVDEPESRRDEKYHLTVLEDTAGRPPEDSFMDNLARLMNLSRY